MAKTGRPKGSFVYDPAKIGPVVLERLAAGESLRSICRDKGMPDAGVVRSWVLKDENFSQQYTLAMRVGLDAMAEKAMEVAAGPGGDVARDRLHFDALRWYVGKRAPERYGDRMALTGADGGPIKVQGVRDYEEASAAAREQLRLVNSKGGGDE